MKTVRSAGVIVFKKDQGTLKYLLLLYPGGYWEFPKGKLESGETDEVAAHRELKEETGLEVTLVPDFQETLSYKFRDRQGGLIAKEVIFFVGYPQSDKVVISDEHKDYKWVSVQEAATYISHTNARELLHKVHNFLQYQS